MKITSIGGGPAGLYFAILMKQAWPDYEINVHERNRADDTFGFGVVFSDQTLETFEKYDPVSYRMITDNFAYWDDIAIQFKGEHFRIGGNGFCGCSRRTLLLLLQERARDLGVNMHFESDITDLDAHADSDLILAADGVNSWIRDKYADTFKPEVVMRPNKFAWMGSTKPLDAFTFYFKETEHGIIIVHSYQYEPGLSTWIFEAQPDTFEKAGFGEMDEQQSADYLGKLFAEELDGHDLIINRSMWRNFPAIRNNCWVKDNIVLMGDAKSTAHFSIGSGTKLAMEDAIALYEAFRHVDAPNAKPDVTKALAHYEAERRDEVERLQHTATVSLVWFEDVDRYWNMDPVQFSFGLMARSKAITYNNLKLRAPEFVDQVDEMFARQVKEQGHADKADAAIPPAFQPFRLRDMELNNRFVVSPMCQYSATDGVPNEWHMVHLGARAVGGAGLVYTEMTNVCADGRISPGCTGIYNDEQEQAWKKIVDFVHANSGSKICMQLGHAGRKGATKLAWDGIDQPLEQGAWPIMAASPLPYLPHSAVPREMSEDDMAQVLAAYEDACARAERAGFDMIELHCAHGYLLASFLSPLTNIRTDQYGGSLENRLRFPLRIFDRLREIWPKHKPLAVRLSACDWKEGGVTDDEAVLIAKAFQDHGCDLIDVSSGQTVSDEEPVYGRMFQVPFSDKIRNTNHIATMAVGNISSADQANTILASGRADLVAFARSHLANPSFALDGAAEYDYQGFNVPKQYEAGKAQHFMTWQRKREEMQDLRAKAKPKSHGPKA